MGAEGDDGGSGRSRVFFCIFCFLKLIFPWGGDGREGGKANRGTKVGGGWFGGEWLLDAPGAAGVRVNRVACRLAVEPWCLREICRRARSFKNDLEEHETQALFLVLVKLEFFYMLVELI